MRLLAACCSTISTTSAETKSLALPSFLATVIAPSELLQLLDSELSGPSPKFLDGDLGVLQLDGGRYVPACAGVVPRRVLDYIEAEGGIGGTTLLARFGAPPYGYTANVVRACVAGLLRAASIEPIAKQTFSCCNEPRFISAFKETGADAAIVIGMETHVCVFQTVRDLCGRGVRVDVPIDGVCSRREDHRQTGLELCARAGAVRTTAETVLFDWMVQSGTDTFKKLAKLVR